jgi:hypothetical protein
MPPNARPCRAVARAKRELRLARRTGRFPQLVDPKSRVNGLLLTSSPRFRAVSLEERCRRRRLTQFGAADAHPPPTYPMTSR